MSEQKPISAVERAAVKQLDAEARDLSFIMTLNPDCAQPVALFDSRAPRICINIAPQCSESESRFCDEALKSVNKPNALASVCLLGAVLRTCTQAPSPAFRHTYSWLYGEDVPGNRAMQNSVFSALEISEADVLSKRVSLPKILAYVEGNKKLWLFFTDGRYDFAKQLESFGALAPFCDAAPPHVQEDRMLNALERCREFVHNKKLLSALQSMPTCFEGESSAPPARGVSQLARLLHKHMPVAGTEEFHNSIALAQNESFTRMHCNKHVKFDQILNLPSPAVRADFVEQRLSVLRNTDIKTSAVESALYRYDSLHAVLSDVSRDQTQTERQELQREARDEGSEERMHESVRHEREVRVRGSERARETLEGLLDGTSDLIRNKKQKVQIYAEIEDTDLEDFRAGLNPNPRMRIHYGGKNTNTVGKARFLSGNYLDIFNQSSSAEMRELAQGVGMNALHGMALPPEYMHDADIDPDDDENTKQYKALSNALLAEDQTSYSARTEAMERKFEKQNCFRLFRRLNNEKRRDIEASNAKNTLEYQQKLDDFKRHACAEVRDAIFGKNTYASDVTAPVRAMATALHAVKQQLPTMSYLNRELSPFANFDLHVTMDLDEGWAPGPMMEDVKLLFYTAMSGVWQHDNLRPNVLLAGAASTGKSHALQIAASVVPDGVHFAVAHETGKAGLVDGMRVNLLQTMEELPEHMMSSDSEEARSHEKNRLTSNILTTVVCNHFKDPETGELKRKMEVFHACEEIGRHAATNLALPDKNNPQLKRWIARQVMPSTDPEHLIMNKMNPIRFNALDGERKRIENFWKLFFSVQMIIEKMIEARAIEDVNMNATAEINQMLAYVGEKYKFDTEDPKMLKKIQGVCRLVTVSYAIYAAVFSEEGYSIRYDTRNAEVDNTGCTDYTTARMRTVEEACVDIALNVEKYLVCTREICVYVFSLLRTEWMPQLRQQILETIATVYHRTHGKTTSGRNAGTEGHTAAVRHCHPMQSMLRSRYRHLNVNEDHTHKWRDASCVFLCDTNGSTRLNDVARYIVNNLPDTTIGYEHVRRELEIMQNVYYETPIWVLPATRPGYELPDNVKPVELKDEAGNICYQKRPLFLSTMTNGGYWDDEISEEFNSATAANFVPTSEQAQQRVGGFNTGAPQAPPTPGGQQRLDPTHFHGTRADNEHGGGQRFAAKNYKQRSWVNLVLYEAIRNPQSHRSILKDAIQSLSHRRQIGSVQTFITSEPAQVEIELPSMSRAQVAAHARESLNTQLTRVPDKGNHSYRLTLFQVPDVVQIKLDSRKIGTITNFKPRLDYMNDRRLFMKDGERGSFARRFVNTTEQSSSTIVLDTDLDMVALMQHHRDIGIQIDKSCHYSQLRARLIRANVARPKEKWQTLKNVMDQHVNDWLARQETSLIQPNNEMTEEEVQELEQHLAETCGRATDLVVSTRLLTENEAESKVLLTCPQQVLNTLDIAIKEVSEEVELLNEYNLDLDSLKQQVGNEIRAKNIISSVPRSALTRSSSSLGGANSIDPFYDQKRVQTYETQLKEFAGSTDVSKPLPDMSLFDKHDDDDDDEDNQGRSAFGAFKRRRLAETNNPLSGSSSSANMLYDQDSRDALPAQPLPARKKVNLAQELRKLRERNENTKQMAVERSEHRSVDATVVDDVRKQKIGGVHLIHEQTSLSETFKDRICFTEIDGKQ